MSLISAKDTFAMFLSTNLATQGISFQWLMKDSSDPALSRLKINAVNLYYMNEYSQSTLDVLQASIDIIHQVERTAILWQDYITRLLRQSGMTKNKYYSDDPGNPTNKYGNVFWDVRGLRWTTINTDDYVQYNLTLELTHSYPDMSI